MGNVLEVIGTVNEELKFSHAVVGNVFYKTVVSCERDSNVPDLIPVVIPSYMKEGIQSGDVVYVHGSFRSFNDKQNSRVRLYIFADEIRHVVTGVKSINNIWLSGYVCKQPVFRLTPKGTKICDVMLAVPRSCGQSDYVPLIMWNCNAEKARNLRVGEEIKLDGRIQSRNYQKKINGAEIRMTAYEVSVDRFESMEE